MEAKRKTSVSLDARAYDTSCELGVNVSAVANVRQRLWLDENAEAFVAQFELHEHHGHP